jgi:hypothetical protein
VMRVILLAAMMLFGFAGAASAIQSSTVGVDGCNLRIEAGVTNWLIDGFDIFDSRPAQATFDMVFANDGVADCQFAPNVIIAGGEPYGLSRGMDERIPYVLFDTFTGFDVTPFTGETRASVVRRQVTLRPGQQQSVQFRLGMPLDELRHDGVYTQPVRIEADRSDGRALAARDVMLGINILPSARLGLAGAFKLQGGQPVVDLGDLHEGPVQAPLRLRVDSTRRYNLTFESSGGGRLRLEGTEWSIPYTLVVDNRTIDLAGGDGVYSSPGLERLRHDSLPLGFVIGSTKEARAGNYSDVLSITVTPQ